MTSPGRPSSSVADGATPAIRDPHWVFDFAFCVALQILCVLPYVLGYAGDVLHLRGFVPVVLSFTLTATVMIRRQLPRLAVIAAAGIALIMAVTVSEPVMAIIVVPIIVYTAARWTDRRWGRIALGLAMFGSLVGPVRWVFRFGYDLDRVPLLIVTMGACASITAGAYLLGRRRNEWAENARQRAQSELERQRLQIAEQAQRDRAAAMTERQRIARELHDIVAHSLSVIVVQAEGGKAIAAKRPERAPEVLGTIAETSRQALAEMRQMVRLLRGETDETDDDYVPTPGLDDLADLVRRTSELAQFTEYGERPVVNPALGLTVYRIVQESLTNVLKHAGPKAHCWVRVAYSAGSIELEVSDDGRGAAATTGDGRGNGLRGMHERVAVHGGRLSAQPRPGGGFVVRASLPLDGGPYDRPPSGPVQQTTPVQQTAPIQASGPMPQPGASRQPDQVRPPSTPF